ncbi:MAG: phosphopantetheine-binding protein [Synergistaceae bacterium]|nr:phosphopantetheine-binding protein [Synergistaceae bacterium]
MLNEITEIIFQMNGRRDITAETDFIKDLKMNSFDIVNLTVAFEERFKISIPTRDLWKLNTVGEFMDYLAVKGTK